MRDLAVLKSMRVERPSPYGWPTFLDDLKAGLVSLLVNIPLAMGIGVVSGMGVPAALYSAVIVGIVSALLGGTRAMKSGPSISLAVIVGTILSSGEADILQIGIVVAMAGAMQIAFGLFGLGRLMAYLPHVVLAGFMSGIGCFLIWSQTWRLIGFGRADMAVAGTCVAIILLWPRVLRKACAGPVCRNCGRMGGFPPCGSPAARSSGRCRQACRTWRSPRRRSSSWRPRSGPLSSSPRSVPRTL